MFYELNSPADFLSMSTFPFLSNFFSFIDSNFQTSSASLRRFDSWSQSDSDSIYDELSLSDEGFSEIDCLFSTVAPVLPGRTLYGDGDAYVCFC